MLHLLASHKKGILFISGCKTNQGMFYPYFDEVILLHAPTHVLHERILSRTNNDYGKQPEEWEEIIHHVDQVEPRLRRSCTVQINTDKPIQEVVHDLIRISKK